MKHAERVPSGFSLIELMMVVAIVGILASLAIPQYQDYSTRARLTEAVQMLAAARVGVAEYAIANGVMPGNAAAAGIDGVESRVVERLLYAAKDGRGILTVKVRNTGSSEADSKFFSMIGEHAKGGATPAPTPGAGVAARGVISWRCVPGDAEGNQPVPARFLPANCRDLTV